MLNMPYAGHMREIPSNPIFDLLPLLHAPGFISLAAGVPAPESFPISDLERIQSRLMKSLGEELMQYGSTEGFPPMRESTAVFLGRAGLGASPQEIFLTTGGQQAIDLICKLMIEPGDRVLVESPTYSATLQILGSHLAAPVGVATDDDGVLIPDLEEKIIQHSPKFVYLIPTYQNPTGRTMTPERRRAAAEVCAKYKVLLVEDDPYRDLSYFGAAPLPIKSYDLSGGVAYITSFSKILCPGLRVGAVFAQKDLIEHMCVAKQASDMQSSNLTQAVVDTFLRDGLIDGHVEKICGLYRERLDVMLEACETFLPDCVEYTRPRGGLFVFCTLPGGIDTEELLKDSVARGVAFTPGAQFYPRDSARKNMLRLNFSSSPPESIRAGMEKLGALIEERSK